MKNRGITLVSLAITVIILLILAAISLNFAIGKHGIITKAKEAKENMLLAQIEEENSLNEIYKQMGIQQDETSGSTGNEEPSNMKQVLEEIEKLKTEIKGLKEKSIDDIYPIGTIYITTDITTAEEMAEKFGGTWESYAQGRTIIGVGTGTDTSGISMAYALNGKGGEYKHTLTTNEMPAHTHTPREGGHYLAVGGNDVGGFPTTYGFDGVAGGGWWFGQGKCLSSMTIEGGSQSHNNIQPYIVTHIWKRVE